MKKTVLQVIPNLGAGGAEHPPSLFQSYGAASGTRGTQ